jgi:Phospholipase_D-nuclease N-terminal
MTPVLLAAAASTAARHPPQLLAALVPLLVLALGLDVYCLIDLFRAGSVRYLPKVVWAIIIVCVSAPIGALVYLFVGRDRYKGSRVPGR